MAGASLSFEKKFKPPVLGVKDTPSTPYVQYDESPLREPCNCQCEVSSRLESTVGTLLLSVTLMVPHTLYGMWEPCNCQ